MKRLLAVMFVVLLSGCSLDGEPDVAQIKSDLMFVSVGDWTFATLSEFKEVNISDRIQQGNTIEYLVTMTLEDYEDGTLYDASYILIYKQAEMEQWQLKRVYQKYLRKASVDGG